MSDKQLVRARVRAARARRDTPAGAAFAQQLGALVTARRARTVTSFVSIGGEPDTALFHEWALEHHVRVLLPCVAPGSQLEWAAYAGPEMATGPFGIPEPRGTRLETLAAAEADLMLIPAAAVDRSGVRLGWGRGFYDRALAAIRGRDGATPEVFAVVFENEVVDRLPADPHDELVAGAVTELHTYRFG